MGMIDNTFDEYCEIQTALDYYIQAYTILTDLKDAPALTMEQSKELMEITRDLCRIFSPLISRRNYLADKLRDMAEREDL